MSEPIGALRRARNVCAILLLPLAASCSAWRPLPGAGFARAGSERLGRAKVSLRDGTELELYDATIGPDSIIGFGGETRTRFAVARREAARVDARQPDGPKTFLAGAVVPFALAVLFVATFVALYSTEGT
jgi:hypothetical protein